MTRIAESEGQLLEPLKAAGIDLFVQPRETTQLRVVHLNVNVDERQILLISPRGYFCIDDMPPIEPCLIHLGGLSDHEFSLEFMRALKAWGFRLSVDMQSFVWQVDDKTRVIRLGDVTEKQEILRMVDFVKLLDHSIEDSLRFAAALTSIKMESTGPFRGSLEDVIERMDDPFPR